MNRIFKKMLSDFWVSKSKTFLALVAIILGIWGSSTIVYTYYISKKDLNDNYIRTNPASAIIAINNLDETLLQQIRELDFVSAVEKRETGIARVRRRNNQWMPIWIFASKDFTNRKISKFNLEKGDFPDQGNILIERDGLQYIDDKNIELQIENNEILFLQKSGSVHDAGLMPSHMDHIIWGYVNSETYKQLFKNKSTEQLLVVFKQDRFKLDQIQKNTNLLSSWLKVHGVNVSQIIIPPPGKHPHDGQLQSLLFLQLGIGILAMILSSMLLINVVNSIMSSQIKQIGIMKAIGATYFQILGIYFGGIFLLALAAILVAMPLGYITAIGYCQFIANELNFDMLNDSIPIWLNVFLVSFLLFLPLISVLPSLNKACKLNVKDALNYEKSNVDSLKKSLQLPSLLPFWLKIALNNVYRIRWGTTLTVFNLMLGLMIISISLNIRNSMSNTFFTTLNRHNYDLSIQLEKDYPKMILKQSLSSIPEIQEVGYWAVNSMSFIENGIRTSDFKLTVFEENSSLLKFDFIAGQIPKSWDHTLIVNPQFIKKYPKVNVGDSVTLYINDRIQKWYIAGIIKDIDDVGVYTSLSNWSTTENGENVSSALKIKVRSEVANSEIPSLTMRIEDKLKANGIGIKDQINQAELLKILNDHINIILAFLIFMAVLVLIIGGLGMISTMNINISERKREIGIMRAVGGSKLAIIKIIFTEIFLLGMISWGLAMVLTFPMSKVISDFFGILILDAKLDFSVDPSSPIITLIVIVSILILSCIIPIKYSTKIPIHKALNEN